MSVKKEPEKHSVELELELPGTPEQVWQAIATGPGISGWFVPSEVDEREGGAVVFHLAPDMDAPGIVKKWDPPHRFAYEEENWSEGAPPLATEFVVQALAGGTCKVRLVHSLFTTSDQWDDELEGMEKGWGPFFEVLRHYLDGFAGQPTASVRPTAYYQGSVDEGWASLKSQLGLHDAKLGERSTSKPGAPVLGGVVHLMGGKKNHHDLMLLLDAPGPGVALLGAYAWGGKVNLAISLYFYGAEAEAVATREEQAWTTRMAKTYPPTSA